MDAERLLFVPQVEQLFARLNGAVGLLSGDMRLADKLLRQEGLLPATGQTDHLLGDLDGFLDLVLFVVRGLRP